MIIRLILILIAFLPLTGFGQKPPDWSDDEKIKGNVKYVKEIPYEIIKKDTSVIKKISAYPKEYFYDFKSNLIKVQFYNIYNRPIKKEEWKYNSNGELLEWIQYNSDNSISGHTIFKYNNNLHVIERFEKIGDVIDLEFKFYYNNDKQLIKDEFYKSSSRKIVTNEYDYDSMGKKIAEKCYEGDRLIVDKSFVYKDNSIKMIDASYGKVKYISMRLDKSGNIIEYAVYKDQINVDYKYTYTYNYDNNGNWIEKRIYNYDGSESLIIRMIEYQ